MSPEANTATPRLFPSQACFVVEDVPSAVDYCVARFGWGPFEQFTAPVEQASYRGWSGRKVTDVALGMAGQVQVELIHVHEGRDPIATYQKSYGTGFQHLGIGCRSREDALRRLEELGAELDSLSEYGDVRIAFVDVPTGPAMFELLQTRPRDPRDGESTDAASKCRAREAFALDRATIVTRDMATALRFYAGAFGWDQAAAETRTLRYGDREARIERFVGRAGTLQLELLDPPPDGDDPYAQHLVRGPHGLVHAGGMTTTRLPEDRSLECEWLEDGESFAIYDWAGGRRALQVREAA